MVYRRVRNKVDSVVLLCGYSHSMCRWFSLQLVNLLKPTGYLMHQQFNIQKL